VDSGPIASVGYRFVARGRSGDRVTSAHGSYCVGWNYCG
jgi:hypothetical protein